MAQHGFEELSSGIDLQDVVDPKDFMKSFPGFAQGTPRITQKRSKVNARFIR